MKIEATSAVTLWGTQIKYGIRRSRRRRTVAISVDPQLGVLLTAPAGVPVGRLDRIVQDKARWIINRLKLIEKNAIEHPPKKFVSGESFLYLGRHYRLRVIPSANPEAAKLDDGRLKVHVLASSKGRARAEAVREAVVNWYRLHALLELRDRVEMWALKVGALPLQLFVRDQKTRWGSCDSKGNLRINWRIIQAPMRIVDYIVVHEMTHLLQKGHAKEFWTAVGRVMPDYEMRRKELRHIGPTLYW
jgi:predicted metal-dependent hydrolase